MLSQPRNSRESRNPVTPGLDQIPVAAVGFDANLNCSLVSAAARALIPFAEPEGLSAAVLFSDWFSPPVIGQACPSVGTARHADGRVFRCELSDTGQGGYWLVLTDISVHVLEAGRVAQDSLTGLMQRGALNAQLTDLLAAADRDGMGAAIHCVDLDRFKAVNDTLGHSIGDLLLTRVAERLRSTLETGDLAARLGGDEFVVVQRRASSPAEAQHRAARLADLIGRTYVIQGHTVHIGASVGVALHPADGKDAETLLRHADLALYRAKADGRGVHRFFEHTMNARMQARRSLELDLRRAMALRQFRLTFQPLVNLETSKVSGFEALIRWHHPTRGSVSPADFIPVAEETGLITAIGEWVLRTACRTAASWPRPVSVAVNISPLQFKTGKLVETVVSALAEAQLPAARLELEITEGALLDETNLVLKTLHAVRDLGVRISMDDFGTGYSSLSYLRKFPFDKIKIDRSFVNGLGVRHDCDAIVRAVTGLGASLGMRTTAEGVETSEQLARIRAEGCTEVQGYYTGRPLSEADAFALLAAQQEQG